ncbi:GntR family transcriptional regulator [Novosphingobium sp. Rr 2-17]|uniref:GntR family transcriptional regulator n=1 Tax=Novosphingobium sp. Rr 2-17 TaxID=555793 RepID=UPI000269AB3E|nr:GntR family transcriptional regulator [Novosphingobium sp. Rr 2-17]EIZ79579.1 GntR family transcriptional regulator [Novosphingobium sp. Rr 2-17]
MSEVEVPDADLITGRSTDQIKRSHRAADRLQRDLLDGLLSDRLLLGSLAEIRERYSLGHGTCREAVGILELRGVCKLRLGRGGGLMAVLPRLDDLARLTLLHLYVKRSTTHELIEARQIIYLSALHHVFEQERQSKAVDGTGAGPACDRAQEGWHGPSAYSDWLADCTGNRAFRFAIQFIEVLCDIHLELAKEHPPEMPARNIQREAGALQRVMSCRNLQTAREALVDYLHLTQRISPDEAIRGSSLLYNWHSTKTGRSARHLAMRLIEDVFVFPVEEGGDLGSEFEIGARHNANATIVRQAIRLLEDLAIAIPRRGRGGGIDVRSPDVSSIVGLVPHILGQEQLKLSECFEAAGMLDVEIARAAAARAGKGVKGKMREHGNSRTPTLAQLISLEQSIADLSGNSVLAACERGFLMYACTIEPVAGAEAPPSAMVKRVLSMIRDVEKCVAAGDVLGAEAAALRKHRLMALRFLPARGSRSEIEGLSGLSIVSARERQLAGIGADVKGRP